MLFLDYERNLLSQKRTGAAYLIIIKVIQSSLKLNYIPSPYEMGMLLKKEVNIS